MAIIEYRFRYLVAKPIKIKVPYAHIIIDDLQPGGEYNILFKLSSEPLRPISLEVHFPNWEKVVARDNTIITKDQVFENFNVFISSEHHTDKARVKIGWDPNHPVMVGEGPFWIYADKPQLVKQPRSEWPRLGLCSSCGSKGSWSYPAALICNNCGTIIGGF